MVYVTGDFTGSVDFGGGPRKSNGLADIFIASYAADGTHRWDQTYGSLASDTGEDLVVDGNGTSYLIGRYSGAMDVGNNVLGHRGGGDFFVASFSSMGSLSWVKDYGGPKLDFARGIALDSKNNVYVSGDFGDTLDFAGNLLTSKGNSDIFLLALSGAGFHRWSKRFGGVHGEQGGDVAVGASNNVIIAGTFISSIDIGPASLKGNAMDDLFVAGFTSGGAYLWSDGYGGKGIDHPHGVATVSNGNVLLTGKFAGIVDFGTGPKTALGTDLFVASFGPGGAPLWSHSFGGIGTHEGLDVAAGPGGAVYVAGYYTSAGFSFGGTNLINKGFDDAFLLKLEPQP
jgi:hypothetical protein